MKHVNDLDLQHAQIRSCSLAYGAESKVNAPHSAKHKTGDLYRVSRVHEGVGIHTESVGQFAFKDLCVSGS
jgi:hypothetical protein